MRAEPKPQSAPAFHYLNATATKFAELLLTEFRPTEERTNEEDGGKNVMEKNFKATCENCGYKWLTKAMGEYATCPHCMRKTRIREPTEASR